MSTDRISDLPDCVLSHILSFLPTKVAISTSLVSRKWRPLPLSLFTLDLEDDDKSSLTYGRSQPFVQFVYKVFQLRPQDLPIKTFRLKCHNSYHASDIDTWIRAAIRCKVERLELSVQTLSHTIQWPSMIFNCETLVVLKLNGFVIRSISSVSLPSLKVLHLQSIQLSDYKCITKIISGCTGLQHLVLKSLAWYKKSEFVNVERLSNLVTADILSRFFPLKVIDNVQYLYLQLDQGSPNHDVPTFNNLVHLELKFSRYKWDLLIEILQNSPKLKSLVILKYAHRWSSTNMEDGKWIFPTHVPECLSSNLATFRFEGYGGMESELQFALYVMKNARALRTMKICSSSYSKLDEKREMLKDLLMFPTIFVTGHFVFE